MSKKYLLGILMQLLASSFAAETLPMDLALPAFKYHPEPLKTGNAIS